MDSKNTEELLAFIAGTDLSEEDKKDYIKYIIFSDEKFRRGLAGILRDNPETMIALIEDYKKRKEIVKNKDKEAWKKLIEEEKQQLKALIAKEGEKRVDDTK